MQIRKIFIAGITGGLTLFALGIVIYLLLFGSADFHHGPTAEVARRHPVIFWIIILMELLYGFFLAWIFHSWARIRTFSRGLRSGALVGFLIGLCIGLQIYGETSVFNAYYIAFWSVTWAIRWAVAGGVIGFILGRGDQS